MRIMAFARAVLLSSVMSLSAEKPRKLFEIGESDKGVGLGPFLEGNMEPFGAVCVGYVKKNSPNHQLLQKLAAPTMEKDRELYELQIPMAAAHNWQETESLQIIKREYGAKLWEMLELPPLDAEPAVFPSKPGKKWKEKDVRKWLLDNAFPTINYRLTGYNGKYQPFPFDKYFGKANSGGVGLVFVKVKDISDFGPQFRAIRFLRPHIERLQAKRIRFAIVEKTQKTLELRQALKMGLNESIEQELVIIDDVNEQVTVKDNYAHGNPHKYRLTDLSEDAVATFFDAYYAGKQPSYWASLDEGGRSRELSHGHLSSMDFEEAVFQANRKMAVFVAFFNDDPAANCVHCESGRLIWEAVAKEVKATKVLRDRVLIFTIDQSRNEHPENLVPGRLGQAMVVLYPPGSAKQRRKNHQLLHGMSEQCTHEIVLEKIKDKLEDLDAEEVDEL